MAARASTSTKESTVKLILIGESGVGKTSLLLQFADGKFSKDIASTVGIDFRVKRTECKGMPIKLQIWDTAGQERFRTVVPSYYRGVMGIAMIYDVTSKDSFNNINYWAKNIESNADEGVNKILIANKTDLEENRVISTEQGQELADKLGIRFMETSAAKNEKVKDMFMTLVEDVVERCESKGGLPKGGNKVPVAQEKAVGEEGKGGCC
ncbi:GTP-binding protein ypt2 [Entamoeba marina]